MGGRKEITSFRLRPFERGRSKSFWNNLFMPLLVSKMSFASRQRKGEKIASAGSAHPSA